MLHFLIFLHERDTGQELSFPGPTSSSVTMCPEHCSPAGLQAAVPLAFLTREVAEGPPTPPILAGWKTSWGRVERGSSAGPVRPVLGQLAEPAVGGSTRAGDLAANGAAAHSASHQYPEPARRGSQSSRITGFCSGLAKTHRPTFPTGEQ